MFYAHALRDGRGHAYVTTFTRFPKNCVKGTWLCMLGIESCCTMWLLKKKNSCRYQSHKSGWCVLWRRCRIFFSTSMPTPLNIPSTTFSPPPLSLSLNILYCRGLFSVNVYLFFFSFCHIGTSQLHLYAWHKKYLIYYTSLIKSKPSLPTETESSVRNCGSKKITPQLLKDVFSVKS